MKSNRSRIVAGVLAGILLIFAAYHVYLPFGIDHTIRDTTQRILQETQAPASITIGEVSTDIWSGDISVQRIVVDIGTKDRLHIGAVDWDQRYSDLLMLPWRDPFANRDSVKLAISATEWSSSSGIDLKIGQAELAMTRRMKRQKIGYLLYINSQSMDISPTLFDELELPFSTGPDPGKLDKLDVTLRAEQNALHLDRFNLYSKHLSFRAGGSLKPLVSDEMPPLLNLNFKLKADSLPVEWPLYPKLGSVAARGVQWNGTLNDTLVPGSTPSLQWSKVDHQLYLTQPTWYPPANIVNTYEMLLETAGLTPRAIGGRQLNIRYRYNPADSLLHLEPVELQADAFNLKLTATTHINRYNPPDGPIRLAEIVITPQSQRFEQALTLLDKWLNMPWTVEQAQRIIRLEGTLSSPRPVQPTQTASD